MNTSTGAQAAADASARFDSAHAALVSDSAIQFEMTTYKPQPPPAWLEALFNLIGASPARLVFWIVLAIAAALLVAFIVNRARDGDWSWLLRRKAKEEEAEAWRPEEAPARALLQEADSLAAAGRFDEAAHLLLFRSIEDIDRRRPDLVRPALTSRDIATAPTLPSGPKSAFGRIVQTVERSLFGGRTLEEHDWKACREAYQEFAFASAWKE
ncbi:MAG TPA: hypothetical protein VIT45_01780 [Allosphingosinicella sp.]